MKVRLGTMMLTGALVLSSACGSSTKHTATSGTSATGPSTSAPPASFTAPAPAACPAIVPSGSQSTAPQAAAPPSGTVQATIAAPRSPQDAVAGNGSVWIVDHRTLDIWRIDPASNQAAEIKYQTNHGDAQVFDVSPGPDGVFAVVGLDDLVDRIDTKANALVQLAQIQGVTAVSDTTAGLWVGIRGGQGRAPVDALVQLDPSTGKELRRVTVGTGGRMIGSGLNMRFGAGSLWVATDENDTVVRVDPQSAKVVAAVKLPGQPSGMAAGPSALYFAVDPGAAQSSGALEVVRVDPQTNCPTAATAFGASGDAAGGLFVAASPDAVYVSYASGAMAVLDPQSLAVRTTYRFDNQQFGGGLDFGFGSVWYTTFDKDNVLRIKP